MNPISGLFSAFGLSTAAGLNAYIPLLVVGMLGRYTELIQLTGPYALLKSPWVLLIIALLALLDFIGDKIPAVDHVLHAVGLVINPIAGAILFLATNNAAGTIDPTLAAISGLFIAGLTHTARATVRPLATATTAGVANPVISFMEDASSLVLSVLALFLPIVAFGLVLLFAFLMFRLVRRLTQQRKESLRN